MLCGRDQQFQFFVSFVLAQHGQQANFHHPRRYYEASLGWGQASAITSPAVVAGGLRFRSILVVAGTDPTMTE
jgi:hypothetical protein